MRRFIHKLLQIIYPSSLISNDLQRGHTFPENVIFVPKTYPNDISPWITFGSNRENYERWIPEICGICCLKMIGDTFKITDGISLYDLTMRCLDNGGFKIKEDNSIEGVFHYPLVHLAQELGLEGLVEKKLDINRIIEHVKGNRFVILSIDLNKAPGLFKGNHLILIHDYSYKKKQFIVHDCAYALDREGRDIHVSQDKLVRMSNARGIALWKKSPKKV